MQNKKFIHRAISIILNQAGFESASSNAIELFSEVFEDRLSSICRSISSITLHGNRTKSTIIDILTLDNNLYPFRISNFENMINNRIEILADEEGIPDEIEWESPLSSRVEKFIHIYDFMPDFPPTHTFRRTELAPKTNKTESLNVKNRMDQSLKSEENMFKLFKASGSIPSIINYLYRK